MTIRLVVLENRVLVAVVVSKGGNFRRVTGGKEIPHCVALHVFGFWVTCPKQFWCLAQIWSIELAMTCTTFSQLSLMHGVCSLKLLRQGPKIQKKCRVWRRWRFWATWQGGKRCSVRPYELSNDYWIWLNLMRTPNHIGIIQRRRRDLYRREFDVDEDAKSASCLKPEPGQGIIQRRRRSVSCFKTSCMDAGYIWRTQTFVIVAYHRARLSGFAYPIDQQMNLASTSTGSTKRSNQFFLQLLQNLTNCDD